MRKRLDVEREAEDELLAAVERYEEKRLGLGYDLLEIAMNALDLLSESTSHSVPVPNVSEAEGMRRVLLRRFPFAVVFVADSEVVTVIAFAHYKQRPGYWLKRV